MSVRVKALSDTIIGGARSIAVCSMAALATTFVAALCLCAPYAAADSTVCSEGSGAGQCYPVGVAVDSETGRLYVADAKNNRIDVFAADGAFEFAFGWDVNAEKPEERLQTCTAASNCRQGSEGTGDGQFKRPERVAVDDDPASPSHHDLYVFDSRNARIEKFEPDGAFLAKREGFTSEIAQLAVSPAGDVFVGDTLGSEASGYEPKIERFNEALAPLEECNISQDARLNNGLAVDSLGDIYGVLQNHSGVFKFGPLPGCEPFGPPYPLASNGKGTSDVRAVALGGGDDLYAVEGVSEPKRGYNVKVVTKYDPAGAILRRYGFDSLVVSHAQPGIAPTVSPAGAFVSDEVASVKRLVEPPAGPLVAALDTSHPVGNVQTTLEAEIDPEGGIASYSFEYVTQKGFEEQGGSFGGPHTKSTSEAALEGSDFGLYAASATIGCSDPVVESTEGKCLEPNTQYRYRVRAKDADGEGEGPVDGTFKTEKAVQLEDLFASGVGADSGRLSMRVNPLGISASGWFELVTQARFEKGGFAEAVQVPDLQDGAHAIGFGAGKAGVVNSSLVELEPGTEYRLRARVTDQLIEEGKVAGITEPLTSEEVVFRTFKPQSGEACEGNEAFRSGFSAFLADCRAYEMVSPLDKEGGDVISQLEFLPELPAVLNQASVSGEKFAYGSYRAFGDATAAPRTSQYIATRTPVGWASHYMLGPRGRLNATVISSFPSELRALSPDLCEAWIKRYTEPPMAAKAVVGQQNLYRRRDQAADCGGGETWEALTTVAPPPQSGGFGGRLDIQGTSAASAETIYVAEANLPVEGLQPPDLENREIGLYYQQAGEGKPRFVCILPNGKPVTQACGAGTTEQENGSGRESYLMGAISADGSRVFWSTEPLNGFGEGKLYLRENPAKKQSASGCEANRACTVAISEEGEKQAGGSSSQFWAANPAGSEALYSTNGNLYIYDVERRSTSLIAEQVTGVMGQSVDLSRIYFVSTKALPSEANSHSGTSIAGKTNLYLYEAGGALRFVAGLGAFGGSRLLTREARSARVTPDGSHLAFMSSESPTGYDNTDASSPYRCLPEPEAQARCDSEVYLYDAMAREGKGKLVCASCNPTGGRPTGALTNRHKSVEEFWAAAALPIWQSSLYPGDLLADGGTRVYFESADALSARDTNGSVDVYQWEAAGDGGCNEASAAYSPQDEGCVTLISSGQGSGDAELLDASSSGDDVFFATAQSLIGADPGLVDIYDARVNGGLPEPAPLAPGCEGEACQSPVQPPNESTPASLLFEGAGDLLGEPLAQGKPTRRALTRAQKLARALRACRHGARRTRAKCARKARRRLGGRAVRAAAKSKGVLAAHERSGR